MGFIQSDTNNVIIDAVLTDVGRQFISKNDGSFSIVKFSPGDDEVDYTLIQKFGRTIGQEKIEKNTPVFEAITNQAYAQKYRLVSVSNPNLIRLPKLTLQGEGVDATGRTISIGNTTVKRRTVTVFQTIQDESSIFVELRDQSFIVELNNMFLEILQASPDNVDRLQRATYVLPRDAGETALGGSKLTLQFATKAILDSQFQIYGARSNKNLIRTFVRVSGVQSGSTYEIAVEINKTA